MLRRPHSANPVVQASESCSSWIVPRIRKGRKVTGVNSGLDCRSAGFLLFSNLLSLIAGFSGCVAESGNITLLFESETELGLNSSSGAHQDTSQKIAIVRV